MDVFLKLIFLVLCSSWLPTVRNQELTCYDEFDVFEGAASLVSSDDIDGILTSAVFDVSETSDVESVLYTISWKDDLFQDPYIYNEIDDNGALKYFVNVTDSEAKTLAFVVGNSMSGIVDYDQSERKPQLNLYLYFDFESLNETCELNLVHNILDENTAAPHFEITSLSVDIREDFPTQLTIPNLQATAYDFDAISPNNRFNITATNLDCPLESEEPFYICEGGVAVPVSFILKEALNYDTMASPFQYECQFLLMDEGSPEMSSTSTIMVTVLEYPDEVPVFTPDYYKGTLIESTANSVVLTDNEIFAEDQDVPPSPIVYGMRAADTELGGDEYFAINSTTGNITVTQDIPDEFLYNGYVNFILTACDTEDQCTTGFISITLPLVIPLCMETLQFEKLVYTVEILTPNDGEFILEVKAQSSEPQAEIEYYFVNDSSPGLDYFEMGLSTGIVTSISSDAPPGTYVLTAEADDGNNTDQCTVNIVVLQEWDTIAIANENIVVTSVAENTSPVVLYAIDATGATLYCKLAVVPVAFKDSFLINATTGEISVIEDLDADNTANGHMVTIKAGAYANATDCAQTQRVQELLSNEVLIEVTITDVNEFPPKVVNASGDSVSQILYAYPVEKSLQRTIGAVASVMAVDEDITSVLTYALANAAENFDIDSSTGDIYLVGDMQTSQFVVQVTDGEFAISINADIWVLDLSNIFTMTFKDTNEMDIEKKLAAISSQAGINIYLLYTSVVSSSSAMRADLWTMEAHIYSTKGLDLLNVVEFNQYLLEAGSSLTAAAYTDESLFVDPSTKDFKTSTIVLGCILGATLLVGIVVLVIYIRHEKNMNLKSKKISTLGEAYSNANFRSDEDNEPSFATIFGNNPVDGKYLTDSIGKASLSSITKRGSLSSLEPKPSTSGPHQQYNISEISEVHSYKSTSDTDTGTKLATTTVTIENDSLVLKEKELEEPNAIIYPSSELTSEYEDELKVAASAIAKATESIQQNAPDVEQLSSEVSEKKSNLKTSVELDFDEPKSVVFKVLVDRKEFEPEPERDQDHETDATLSQDF